MVLHSKNKKGQATVEYLLLLVVITVIFWKVIVHVQDVLYGWKGNKGAIESFVQNQVVDQLSLRKQNGWF